MPGVLIKKIKEFRDKVSNDILGGEGLVEYRSEVDAAIEAGAAAVSTAKLGTLELPVKRGR